jgi:hypothetical protein
VKDAAFAIMSPVAVLLLVRFGQALLLSEAFNRLQDSFLEGR